MLEIFPFTHLKNKSMNSSAQVVAERKPSRAWVKWREQRVLSARWNAVQEQVRKMPGGTWMELGWTTRSFAQTGTQALRTASSMSVVGLGARVYDAGTGGYGKLAPSQGAVRTPSRTITPLACWISPTVCKPAIFTKLWEPEAHFLVFLWKLLKDKIQKNVFNSSLRILAMCQVTMISLSGQKLCSLATDFIYNVDLTKKTHIHCQNTSFRKIEKN